jgi:uncharacterized alpha-E superfamily protein
MLSRTADNLYWMARYMERVENMARMLEAAHRMALVAPEKTDMSEWLAVLSITGTQEDFFANYPVATPLSVAQFIAVDKQNPASIAFCVGRAREAARCVRGHLGTELWECLNTTWLEFKANAQAIHSDSGLLAFCHWIKERAHLFRGMMYGTLRRDEAFYFCKLGIFLERADNTARILDVKYHVLLPSIHDVGGAADYYHWNAVLEALSAMPSYRTIYRDAITPFRVAELLVLRRDFPRSLCLCLSEVRRMLAKLSSENALEAQRLAGQLYADLYSNSSRRLYSLISLS